MKLLKKKWIIWYSKVLAACLTLLGFVSACTKEETDYPMYGIPVVPTDSIDTLNHVMYGVPPTLYVPLDDSQSQTMND